MKPNRYLAGLLILITSLASGQSRFSLSATGAPALSYTNYRGEVLIPSPTTAGQFVPLTLSSRSTAYGVSAGFMGQYALTPNWSVSTGLWYDQLTQTNLDFAPTGPNARVVTANLKVPVLLNFKPLASRLSPFVSAGMVLNYTQPTRLINVLTPGSDVRVQFANSATYRAVLAAGVAYRLNRHFSVTFQPTLLWRFRPNSRYDRFVSYQLNGQTQLVYSF